ncbi:hypothetical protein HME7025_01763 [Aquirufa nivalisilvae]|uniref:Uncharacterized protein n=1 Tax=Aquirufa nivalisilvae TaxID=2516557 RepID=A0A2S2DW53_9BACT|nr:hypothetical protein [Aquirufa nivalisilvae]AWL09615.1 hypothetical protein HME7025_01763 [Aquirufa nivalisilvae]
MFKCYNGEEENPFDPIHQNTKHMFWFYESVFESSFSQNKTSDWINFFSSYDLKKDFMQILSEEDKVRPSLKKKKQIFDLWLIYFFTHKLYREHGGENSYEKLYRALR